MSAGGGIAEGLAIGWNCDDIAGGGQPGIDGLSRPTEDIDEVYHVDADPLPKE